MDYDTRRRISDLADELLDAGVDPPAVVLDEIRGLLGAGPRWIAHYRDDGPAGPCGQTMSVTSPWSRLLVYEGPSAESDARALSRYLQAHHNAAGRRNARIECIYSDHDENVEAGWIVPEAERA